jgi:hypothetical protein
MIKKVFNMTNPFKKESAYRVGISFLGLLSASTLHFACAAPAANTSTGVEPNPASNAPAIVTKGSAQINAVTRNNTKSASTLVLAENGAAKLPIVIAAGASKETKAIADEFAEYLKRITGADFEITTGDGTSGIVLGTLADFPTPALDKALEIFNGYDGVEAFAIRTRPKRLLLLGATPKAVPHAAFRLLEEIGYRHFFSHPAWEVVPHKSTLTFDRDITDRPAMLSREIVLAALLSGEVQHWKEYYAWKRHNGMAQSFVPNAGHNYQSVIDANKEAFEQHPEYYALVKQADGSFKREGPQLELANPAVRKMIVDYAVSYFDKNPDQDMVSVEPADTILGSQSKEAKAAGPWSDLVFGVANEAARAVQKTHPGKMVGVLSYNAHWDPPSFSLEPNVHVQLSALGSGTSTLSPEKRDELWQQRSKNLGFYDYYSVFAWNGDMLPAPWINDIHELQRAVRRQIAMGGTALHAESSSSWGLNGRAYYLADKLLWNPDIDVDAVLQDFYSKAFGAGAAAMQRYYERFDPASKPLLSGHLLGLMFRDVDEASRSTQDRPDVQARLDQIKLYLNFVRLSRARDVEAKTDEERNALKTQILTTLFRARPYAMNSWEFFRQQWGDGKWFGRDQAEWMVDKPYTHEEIEQEFQQGLHHFESQIRDVGNFIPFSDDLVRVNWPDEHPQIVSKQVYQGTQKYYLYSKHGEPLEFTTWAGDAFGYIGHMKVLDAKGNVIYSRENIPLNSTTENKIPVPAPGLYVLDYDDNGGFWSMETAPGVVATIPLLDRGGVPSGVFRNPYPQQRMYFYIPKGVRTFEYFYTRTRSHTGGPHSVLNPKGESARPLVGGVPVEKKDIYGNWPVDVNGDYVTVPVPEGMDGHLWSLDSPVLGFFRFNNAPNYIAASPDALLVPREVAEKDGLQIIK